MKNIDSKFLVKFFDKACSFSVSEQDEKKKYIERCTRFLKNKTYKLAIKGEVYYAMFVKENVLIDGSLVNTLYGLQQNSILNPQQYKLRFLNEKGTLTVLRLHRNDFFDIEYEEIENKEYYEMVQKFI